MRKNINTFIYIAITLIFISTGLYFFLKQDNFALAEKTAANNFFNQSMIDTKGKTHLLSEWKGKNLVLNFWATWCTPCVQEMPELSALQVELATHNIQIIGLGIDSHQNISDFSRKYQIAYPLYVAEKEGAELSRQFGNQKAGLPFTVLLGADGTVKKTYLGRLKMEELRKDIALF